MENKQTETPNKYGLQLYLGQRMATNSSFGKGVCPSSHPALIHELHTWLCQCKCLCSSAVFKYYQFL